MTKKREYMKRELKIFTALVGIFLVAYVLPLGNPKIQQAIQEAFRLLQWYARNHTLPCVVPALFIAGAIITFLSIISEQDWDLQQPFCTLVPA